MMCWKLIVSNTCILIPNGLCVLLLELFLFEVLNWENDYVQKVENSQVITKFRGPDFIKYTEK